MGGPKSEIKSPDTHVEVTCKALKTRVRFPPSPLENRTVPRHTDDVESAVSLRCHGCKTKFTRRRAEVRRQERKGRKHHFCSHACSTRSGNRIRLKRGEVLGDPDNVSAWAGNRRDKHTPFRWFVSRAKYRKKHVTDITAEYLKELWETQKGLCPFTGWGLILPQSSFGFREGSDPMNASIDRIDYAKGYIEGNVRFISVMANLARQRFTDAQVREFCRAVAAFNE